MVVDFDKYMNQSRVSWKRAGRFPMNKVDIYPEHRYVQEFDDYRGKDIADYGSGPGADAFEYAKRGNKVVLIDIVEENLEQSEKNLEDAGIQMSLVDFCHLDCSWEIPYDENTFDVVNSNGVLHHILPEYQDKVLLELNRICKVGGFCYIMLYTPELRKTFTEKITNLIQVHGISDGEAFGWCTDGEGTPWSSYFTEEEGFEYLRRSGFTPVWSKQINQGIFRHYKSVKKEDS